MASSNKKGYSASTFFGDLFGTAKDLGKGYLDFQWGKYKFDEELMLAEKYNAAVAQQNSDNTPSTSGGLSNSNMIKYGLMAFGGLITLLVVAKAFK